MPESQVQPGTVELMDAETILVRVQGPDRPGLFAGLLRLISEAGAEVQDIEQIVIRRRLSLSLITTVPAGRDVIKELLLFGWEHNIEVDFEVVEPNPTDRELGMIVTVMGREVSPSAMAAVAEGIAKVGGNIERIIRLSKYPVLSYELIVSGTELAPLKAQLLGLSHDERIDIAIQREGLGRKAKRLVVMDVDSTLIMDEAIELLAEEAGTLDQVAQITEAAMRGELDFEESLTRRVALLAGLDRDTVQRAVARLTMTPGARTFVRTLRRLGFHVAIVSGGFTDFTDRLKAELEVDRAHANVLERDADGKLTGKVTGRIIDRAAKAELLEEIAAEEGIPLDQTVAVGDGANDLDMLSAAGLGIAFNAKPVVRAAADTTVNVPYLDAVLFVLGVRRTEVEAADSDDPPLPVAWPPTPPAG